MSTHSLLTVSQNGSVVLNLHVQYDGYPQGFGKDLAEFLTGFQITTGVGNALGKYANGAPCLAGQIVAHFKTGPGDFYLLPATNPYEYEWAYNLDIPFNYRGPIERLPFSVRSYDKDVFYGTLDEFNQYLEEHQK